MSNTNYSGERFIPEMNDPELEIEHLERYYAVQKLVSDMEVLDAACGEGYGSSILAEKAKSVTSVDIDQETILAASEKYKSIKNLHFYQGSIANLSMIETASKDIVVSFETIEHVSRELQQAFLKEIKRILRPNGFVVMSTPDKKEYTDRYQFHNKFHVAEFYVDEFITFLNQEFKNLKLYNQYLEVASFIDQSDVDREEILFVKDSNKYNPIGKYVIAVAGNKALPETSLSAAFMHHRAEYLPTLDELNYCRKEALTCRKKVEKLDECLNENKLQKEELDRRAVELDKRMQLINKLEANVQALENVSKQQLEEMDRRAAELDKRMQLINELEAKIQVLENGSKQQLEELDRRAVELDKRMQLINELEREKQDIENNSNLQNEELKKEIQKLKDEGQQQKEELDNRMNLINHLGDLKAKAETELEILKGKFDDNSKYLDKIHAMNLKEIIKWYISRHK